MKLVFEQPEPDSKNLKRKVVIETAGSGTIVNAKLVWGEDNWKATILTYRPSLAKVVLGPLKGLEAILTEVRKHLSENSEQSTT